MFEAQLFVPVADNDGKVFSQTHHQVFEAKLLASFGGFTRGAEVEGAWLDDGTVYKDRIVIYTVALQSIAQGAEVVAAAQVAKSHYRQEAIYLRYLGLAEII